jgi:hypothetical protein
MSGRGRGIPKLRRFLRKHIKFKNFKRQKLSAPKEWHFAMIYALGLPICHVRDYEGLKAENDFYFFRGRKKRYPNGYNPHQQIAPEKTPQFLNTKETVEIHPKTLNYLTKIIELCKNSNTELLLIATPYIAPEKEMKIFNTVNKIAQENGIKFINYNLSYKEIGFDFATDVTDPTHANDFGANKISKDLADKLASWYGLTDNRNNPKDNDWHIWAEQFNF